MLGSSAFAVALKQTQHKQISTCTYIKQFQFPLYSIYTLFMMQNNCYLKIKTVINNAVNKQRGNLQKDITLH